MNDLSNFWLPTLSKICPQLLSWDSQRVIAKYVKRPAKKAKAVSGIMKSNDIKLGAQLAESDRIVAYCQTHCSKVSIEYFQKIGISEDSAFWYCVKCSIRAVLDMKNR